MLLAAEEPPGANRGVLTPRGLAVPPLWEGTNPSWGWRGRGLLWPEGDGEPQRSPASPSLPGLASLPSELVLLLPPVAHLEQKFRGCPGVDAAPVPRAGSQAVSRTQRGPPPPCCGEGTSTAGGHGFGGDGLQSTWCCAARPSDGGQDAAGPWGGGGGGDGGWKCCWPPASAPCQTSAAGGGWLQPGSGGKTSEEGGSRAVSPLRAPSARGGSAPRACGGLGVTCPGSHRSWWQGWGPADRGSLDPSPSPSPLSAEAGSAPGPKEQFIFILVSEKKKSSSGAGQPFRARGGD